MTGIIIAAVIVVPLLIIGIYIGATYNGLVKLKNSVEEAFSTMDVYLKKRWDLIPNIVESVKGYAKHEAQTLQNVISARNVRYSDMTEEQKHRKCPLHGVSQKMKRDTKCGNHAFIAFMLKKGDVWFII